MNSTGFVSLFISFKVLNSQSRAPMFKTTRSKVDSVFHPSDVGKMSNRNFWELSGKK